MKITYALCILIFVAGCASSNQPLIPTQEISAPFDVAQASQQLLPGPNFVKGNAFMRQRGGGVVTCAGQVVHLIPATPYAKARFFALYNTNEAGVNIGRNFRFVPDPPEYYTKTREVKCDSQGNFTFERIADGDFFVATQVSWQVGNSTEGGNLMQRVTLSGGQTISLVLAP